MTGGSARSFAATFCMFVFAFIDGRAPRPSLRVYRCFSLTTSMRTFIWRSGCDILIRPIRRSG